MSRMAPPISAVHVYRRECNPNQTVLLKKEQNKNLKYYWNKNDVESFALNIKGNNTLIKIQYESFLFCWIMSLVVLVSNENNNDAQIINMSWHLTY